MFSRTVNTPKPLFLSTTFLPNYHHHYQPPPPNPHKPPPKALFISSLIPPPSSSTPRKQQQQQFYQRFKPPPSPLPPQYRDLDTNARLEILSNRLGAWFEYAPLISSLISEGITSSALEEITGISSVEQNRLIVAAQVRDSLVQSTDDETVSFFDQSSSPDILYEIRTLNNSQRAAVARFIVANGFDGIRAEELARSIKDFPHRYGARGWESFDGNLPGDCLAFMYFRQAQEHKSASFPELIKAALEVVESEKAKQMVEDMKGGDGEGRGRSGLESDDTVRVPVVRMGMGEVAESSAVVLLPVRLHSFCC